MSHKRIDHWICDCCGKLAQTIPDNLSHGDYARPVRPYLWRENELNYGLVCDDCWATTCAVMAARSEKHAGKLSTGQSE